MKNRTDLTGAFKLDPVYLKHRHQASGERWPCAWSELALSSSELCSGAGAWSLHLIVIKRSPVRLVAAGGAVG